MWESSRSRTDSLVLPTTSDNHSYIFPITTMVPPLKYTEGCLGCLVVREVTV